MTRFPTPAKAAARFAMVVAFPSEPTGLVTRMVRVFRRSSAVPGREAVRWRPNESPAARS